MTLLTSQIREILDEVLTRRGRRVFDLPEEGQISAGDINEELGRPQVSQFSIDGTEERALAGVVSGQISFEDFHGKSAGNLLTVGLWAAGYGFNSETGDFQPSTINIGEGIYTCDLNISPFQGNANINLIDTSHIAPATVLAVQLETFAGSGVYTTYNYDKVGAANSFQSSAVAIGAHFEALYNAGLPAKTIMTLL